MSTPTTPNPTPSATLIHGRSVRRTRQHLQTIGPCLAILLFATTATCQGFVVPSHFTITEGPTYWNLGLGNSSVPARFLQVCDEMQGRAGAIQAVSFRRDGASPASVPAFSAVVNLLASTAMTGAASPNPNFDANHGTDRVQVATFHMVSFPATGSTPLPAPFDYRIPFTTPFQFTGTGPLCVEIQLSSRTLSQGFNLDWAWSASSNPPLAYRSHGVGCRANGQQGPAVLNPSGSANWPANSVTFRYDVARMPPNGLLTLLIGVSQTNFGGLPLPLELPGTATGPSGACTIYQDVLLQIPILSNSSGSGTQNLGLPVTPLLNGASLLGQVLAVDPGANTWGLVLTNSVQHQVVAPHGSHPVGSVAGDGFPTSGTVRSNSGFVMRIE